jgi:hypothetical protein
MTFFSKRKRKNDDPPRFPAWLFVLIAIGLVMIIAMLLQPVSRNTSPVTVNSFSGDFVTPTRCIRQDIPQSNVTASNNSIDPLEVTATYIVGIATSEAQGTRQPCL